MNTREKSKSVTFINCSSLFTLRDFLAHSLSVLQYSNFFLSFKKSIFFTCLEFLFKVAREPPPGGIRQSKSQHECKDHFCMLTKSGKK